ncbi:BrxA family protein [candidate division KSB1 bacterium]
MHLNTDINVIASIPDFELLFRALELAANDNYKRDLKDLIIGNNVFNLRTEYSKVRFVTVAKTSYLKFQNDDHKVLITSLFRCEGLGSIKQLVLFWQLAINNKLFFLITKDVFLKLYFQGRIGIPKDELLAYLKYLAESYPEIKSWSASTHERIASKYLTFMKRIGLLEGSQKKVFRYIRTDTPSFVYFIYLAKAVYPEVRNIFDTPLFDFCLMSQESFMDWVRQIKLMEYFNITTDGNKILIELKVNFEDIVNVLSNRT